MKQSAKRAVRLTALAAALALCLSGCCWEEWLASASSSGGVSSSSASNSGSNTSGSDSENGGAGGGGDDTGGDGSGSTGGSTTDPEKDPHTSESFMADGGSYTIQADGSVVLTSVGAGVTQLDLAQPVNGTMEDGTEISARRVSGIDAAAFNGASVTSVAIPASLCEDLSEAIKGNSQALSIKITGDGTHTEVPDNAFEGSAKVAVLVVGEGVTRIGTASFKNCSALNYVRLESGVTTIGAEAFYSCTNLATLELPATLKTLELDENFDSDAFCNCNKLFEGYSFSQNTVQNIYYTGTKEQWEELKEDHSFVWGAVWGSRSGTSFNSRSIFDPQYNTPAPDPTQGTALTSLLSQLAAF